jgi:hypothetical protein
VIPGASCLTTTLAANEFGKENPTKQKKLKIDVKKVARE